MNTDARRNPPETNFPECMPASELDAWFSVPGDMDDFIFYGEPEPASGRRIRHASSRSVQPRQA